MLHKVLLSARRLVAGLPIAISCFYTIALLPNAAATQLGPIATAVPVPPATETQEKAALATAAANASYLALQIGETDIRFRLHLAYPVDAPEAEEALERSSEPNWACTMLGGLSINDNQPLCTAFTVSDTETLERRVIRSGKLLHIDVQRSVALRNFGARAEFMRFCAPGNNRPKFDRLIVDIADTQYFRLIEPIPDELTPRRIRFSKIPSICPGPGLLVGVARMAERTQVTKSDKTGPISFADLLTGSRWGEIDYRLQRAFSNLPNSLLLAMPAVLLVSLLGAIKGRWPAVVETQRRRAVMLCWFIAACAWLPFVAVQWEASAWLWRDTPLWAWIIPGRGMPASGQFDRVIGAIGSTITIAAAVLFGAVASGLVRRILKRLGWDMLVPTWRPVLLAGVFSLALVTLGTGISLLAMGAPELGERVPYEIYLIAACLPLVFCLFAPMARTIPLLLGRKDLRPSFLVILLGSILLVIPFRASISSQFGTILPWEAITPGALNIIYILAPIAAYLTLFPAAWLLQNIPKGGPLTSAIRLQVGAMLLACFVVGIDSRNWITLLALLLALGFSWPRVALAPWPVLRDRRRNRRTIQADYAAWTEKLTRAQDLRESLRGPKLREKLGSGEWKPEDWAEKRTNLETAYATAIHALRLPYGATVRALLLAYSIEQSRWENALRAIRFGLPWIALIVFLQATRLYADAPGHPQPQLVWLSSLIGAVALPSALALLFGYFFEELRGTSGLNKALWLAFAVALARLPLLLVYAKDPSASAAWLWTVGQQSVLLILIGVFGFDYARMRLIQGRLFDWRRFTWFGDAQLLGTGVLTTAAGLVPLVAGLVNKDFAGAVIEGLKATLPGR